MKTGLEQKGKLSKRKEKEMLKKGILHTVIIISSIAFAFPALYKIIAQQSARPSAAPQAPTTAPLATTISVPTPSPAAATEAVMTVFVHGSITHLVRKPNLETIVGIARDQIEGTLYQKATEHMRKNPFFRRDQAMQDLGLQLIDKTSMLPGKASTALANIFDQIDLWTTGKKPETNYYYTFGWEALVSQKVRYRNAEQFYAELFAEINRLKLLGYKKVILKIIGFSHGGSVSLTLANVHNTKPIAEQISVDELILMGTPLHAKMYEQICNPIFKKVFNLYSPKDRAQGMDLTVPGAFASQRTFSAPKGCNLPEKLTQVQLSITRNRSTKYQIDPARDPRKDFSKTSIVHGNSELLRRVSPGHVELWFFHWAVCGYRDSFSLRPLPTVVAVPIILDAVKKYAEPSERNFYVDLRPDQELFLVKTKQRHVVVPLLSKNQFDELKAIARAYEVTQHPSLEYDEQARMAIMWARQERKLLHINKTIAKQEKRQQLAHNSSQH